MEKDKISFKPLHEGMGFHPFSDGLPYAPESKASSSSTVPPPKTTTLGAGATAAGRPQFATARQLKQIQDQYQVTPSLIIPSNSKSSARPQPQPQVQARQQPQPKPQSQPRPSPTETASLSRRRIFAYLMDTVIHTGFWVVTNLAALFFFNFQIDAQILQDHLAPFLAFFLVSQWLFISLQEMLFETTIGKAFFNLEFKRNHYSLFLRSIVFMVGTLALGLGLYFRIHDKLGQLQLKQKIYS